MKQFLLNARQLALLATVCLATSRLCASPGAEMADAANNFLKALAPEQQAKATYALSDEERFDWHFIPKPRKGLPFKEMTSAQQKLAHALLSSGTEPARLRQGSHHHEPRADPA